MRAYNKGRQKSGTSGSALGHRGVMRRNDRAAPVHSEVELLEPPRGSQMTHSSSDRLNDWSDNRDGDTLHHAGRGFVWGDVYEALTFVPGMAREARKVRGTLSWSLVGAAATPRFALRDDDGTVWTSLAEHPTRVRNA